MKNLTIKQRLLSMTIILAILIAGLSLFFINRFGVMADTYSRITENLVPQEQVSSYMFQVLQDQQININNIYNVKRNLSEFNGLQKLSENKINEFELLHTALLSGNNDLGETIQDLEGVSIRPILKGSEVEALVLNAGDSFKAYQTVYNNIISKKREELELSNIIGWYDNRQESKGMIKDVTNIRLDIKKSTTNLDMRFLLDELEGYETSIIKNPDEVAINRYKDFAENGIPMFDTMDRNVDPAQKFDGNPLIKYDAQFGLLLEKLLERKAISEELSRMVFSDYKSKHADMQKLVKEIKNNAKAKILTASAMALTMEKSAKWIISIISMFVIGVGLFCGWFASYGINKKLYQIIQNLGESSEQVASASGQVSSSSQLMSEGSSEQAASIEETSSSLEEMSSMTKQNADNSNQANNLMTDANKVVTEADNSMDNLIISMEEISKASDETSKIIKTIDEIAFQTNLLALNAAVEAARAGEAGAGFAVVADEVRNLAMRAADAAKNTSTLIEGTVKKIKEGSVLVTSTNDAFSHVSESATKVGELIAEITAASREQAQGIEQVTNAVNEMDKVVQQNAATSEETASASEEMNAQAEQMKYMVDELWELVYGNKKGDHKKSLSRGEDFMATMEHPKHEVESDSHNAGSQNHMKKTVADLKAYEVKPEQVLPLDEKELENF